MIFLILTLVCLADAKPYPGAGTYAVEGVQGILYELPEYDDSDVDLFQLSGMGVMPVLTVLEMAKDLSDLAGQKDTTFNIEELDGIRRSLDGIIGGLEVALTKVESGSTNIFTNIDKALQTLSKLKNRLVTDVHHVSISKQDSLNTEGKDEDFKAGDAEKTSIQPTECPECPDLKNTTPQGTFQIEALVGDALMMSGTKKLQDVIEKAILHKKWSWKLSNKEQ